MSLLFSHARIFVEFAGVWGYRSHFGMITNTIKTNTNQTIFMLEIILDYNGLMTRLQKSRVNNLILHHIHAPTMTSSFIEPRPHMPLSRDQNTVSSIKTNKMYNRAFWFTAEKIRTEW